jgi:hypothetical protein
VASRQGREPATIPIRAPFSVRWTHTVLVKGRSGGRLREAITGKDVRDIPVTMLGVARCPCVAPGVSHVGREWTP